MAASPLINQTFALSEKEIQSFAKDGFVLLKGLFAPKAIEVMQEITAEHIKPPSDNYGSGFSKLQYDIGNDDPRLFSVIADPLFSRSITDLCRESLFFTQGLGFELQKNVSSGFPWHVGTQSFGFQRLSDLGVTLWTPLCEIIPATQGGQGGGMAYLSRKHLSGEFVYQHIQMIPEYLRQPIHDGSTFSTFSSLKNELLNSDTMRPLLDYYATEDRFELGDALLFDKWVMHRSAPLTDGPLNVRQAFAWRFSSTAARYDQARVENLAYPRDRYDYDVGSPFNDIVAQNDGELVYESDYFASDRSARTLPYR